MSTPADPDRTGGYGIDDEDLPEDVRPGEDNPLAEPLPDDVESPFEPGDFSVEADPQDENPGEDSEDS